MPPLSPRGIFEHWDTPCERAFVTTSSDGKYGLKAWSPRTRRKRPKPPWPARTFTICFYGTTQSQDRISNSFVGHVYGLIDGEPSEDKIVCDGVGGLPKFRWWGRRRPPEKGNIHAPKRSMLPLAGVAGGWGMEDIVESALGALTQHRPVTTAYNEAEAAHCIGRINIVGYSRGAVQAFLLARKLAKSSVWGGVEVNIFALDPVPGPVRYEKMGAVASNVRNVKILVAEHEHALGFEVLLPHIASPEHTHVEMDLIPGGHVSIVLPPGTQLGPHQGDPAIYSVVLSRALCFLRLCGTPLRPESQQWMLSDAEYLRTYWEMLANWRVSRQQMHPFHRSYYLKTQAHVDDLRPGDSQLVTRLPVFRPIGIDNKQPDRRRYVNLHHCQLDAFATHGHL